MKKTPDKFVILFMLSMSIAASPATAGLLGDDIVAHVGVSYLEDTNLFRDEFEEKAVGRTRERGGIFGELEMGQQKLTFNGNIHNNHFNKFHELDYVGGSGKTVFEWTVGKALGGAIDISYSRDLTGFDQFIFIEKDLTTIRTGGASVTYSLTPRLQLRGAAGMSDLQHSQQNRSQLELEETEYDLSVMFLTRPGTFIGVGTTYTSGKYPNRDFTPISVLDNRYQQVSPALIVEWEPSDRQSVNFRIGNTSRDHENFSEADFSEVTGGLEIEYRVSPKTEFEFAYSRHVRSIDEQGSRAALVDRFELKPSWSPRRNLTINLRAVYRRQDFIGLRDLPDAGRKDKESFLEVLLFYRIADRLLIDFSAGGGTRESSRPGFDYDFSYTKIGLRFEF